MPGYSRETTDDRVSPILDARSDLPHTHTTTHPPSSTLAAPSNNHHPAHPQPQPLLTALNIHPPHTTSPHPTRSPQQHPPSKVKVSGLRPATNRDDVAALFKDLGLRLKRMQRLCPFAILEFTTPLGAAMAVATLNMRGLGGGLLKVEVWEDAPEPGTQAQGAAAQGQGGEKGAGAESARDASQAGEYR